jgi:membrane protease YdiL (CAAX protease family)
MRFLKQLAVVVLVSFAGGAAVQAVTWNAPLTVVVGVAVAVLALAAYAWVVRKTEHREPLEVARKTAPAALGRGVLIGLGMFLAVIVNIAFLGGYEIRGWGSVSGAIAIFGFMAAAAVTEELMFRGVLFRIVEERLGTGISLGLSGVLFGLAHYFNPNATLWSSFAIAVEAGFMLAAVYAATRNLWVPIGVHFAWNLLAGPLLGYEVSGHLPSESLAQTIDRGSVLMTGGDFGIEGSVVITLLQIVALAALAAGVRQRDRNSAARSS